MSRKFLLAAILNWGVAAALAGVGIDYLTSRTLKPHHVQVLDVPWESLSPRTQSLMITLMKGTGLAAVVAAVAMAVLLCEPFRRREPWSRVALLIVSAAAIVPALIGTIQVRSETGADAPWWPHAAMLAALAAAFWLTRDFAPPGKSP
jgi:hypothetical protein